MLDLIEKTNDKMIVGFDLINEEDFTEPIDRFLEMIYTTKQRLGDRFKIFASAGQSNRN